MLPPEFRFASFPVSISPIVLHNLQEQRRLEEERAEEARLLAEREAEAERKLEEDAAAKRKQAEEEAALARIKEEEEGACTSWDEQAVLSKLWPRATAHVVSYFRSNSSSSQARSGGGCRAEIR